MQGYGSGSGGTELFARGLVRWRFFLLLAGTVLTILFGQAESARAARFFDTGSMGSARQDHTATLLPDGSVLVTGGMSASSGILGSAEIYNLSSGTFSATTGAMNIPRQYHTATRLADGRVLITGGVSSSGTPVSSAEIYDPATGTFTLTGTMNSLRRNHTATLLESGKVLITGGRNGSSSSSTLSTAELFDPAANGGVGAFSLTKGAMATARGFHTASLLTADGKVLITGGITTGLVSLASAELYDPGADSFAATGDMHVARNYHADVVLQDGRVLIVGGTSGSSGPSLATAELYVYDSTTGTGTFGAGTKTMNAGHSRGTAALLANGNVLVAGDFSSSGIPGSAADLFLSGDGGDVFLPIDPMNTVRSNFRAVSLSNGTVLLAGGVTTGSQPTAAAELFNPSAVRVTPAGNTFPDTGAGSTSAAQTFTISSNADLAIAPFSITGTNSTMFSIAGSTCTTQPIPPVTDPPPPPSVPAGGSCTINITFSPASTGAKSATLIITTDDPAIPVWNIPLAGTGVIATSTLTVTFAGDGGGDINSNPAPPLPAGIPCSGSNGTICQASYNKGTAVTLLPTGNSNSLFGSWASSVGTCNGTGSCVVTLNSSTPVTVTFNYVKPARVVGGLDYDTLLDAYNNAVSGHKNAILAREFSFPEVAPVFDDGGAATTIALTGGYDKNYSSNSGMFSTVNGITIKKGTLVLSNIVVR